MAKIFPTFPSHLEHFNPERLPTQLELGEKMFDENGELHSYDDKPIFAQENAEEHSPIFLLWYFHGRNYREGDKPSCISLDDNEYTTYDEDMEQHSYGGLPAVISYNEWTDAVEFLWYNHGCLHHDDDKPASIRSSGLGQTERYYKNGLKHRDNNLPAVVLLESKKWFVQDILHNPEGLAVMQAPSQLRFEGIHAWSLYGVQFSEDIFNQIKDFTKKNETPLWVSLFVVLNIINSEHIKEFMDSYTGKWSFSLPVEWYIRLWNINEKVFAEGIKKNAQASFDPNSYMGSRLINLLQVAKYEEQNMVQPTNKKKNFNV